MIHSSRLQDDLEGSDFSLDQAADIIEASANDIHALWHDSAVRAVLDKRGVNPEEWPGL